MDFKRVTQFIQAGTETEMYCQTTKAALFLAAGGFLKDANKILETLWSYQLPHDPNTWLPDRGFTILWDAQKSWPDKIPFELLSVDEIEIFHRGYMAKDMWAYPRNKNDWKKLAGTDLIRIALITAGLTSNNAMPPVKKELLALEMLEKYIEANPKDDTATVLAAELAARNNDIDKAIRFTKIWAESYPESGMRFRFDLMTNNRHMAPLLLKHLVSSELGLNKTKAKSISSDLIDALQKRMKSGRSLVYAKFNWRKILKRLSELSLEHSYLEYPKARYKTNWLGFNPASNAAIKTTEKRLGIQLPEDYKSFLRISNGFLQFPACNPALSPVGKIDYLKNIEEPSLFAMYEQFPTKEDDEEPIFDCINRAILISKYPDEQMVWLIPPKNDEGSWQTWFFANWVPGEVKYPSFRYFIENQIQNIESRDNS